jgi:hypothetical protein
MVVGLQARSARLDALSDRIFLRHRYRLGLAVLRRRSQRDDRATHPSQNQQQFNAISLDLNAMRQGIEYKLQQQSW